MSVSVAKEVDYLKLLTDETNLLQPQLRKIFFILFYLIFFFFNSFYGCSGLLKQISYIKLHLNYIATPSDSTINSGYHFHFCHYFYSHFYKLRLTPTHSQERLVRLQPCVKWRNNLLPKKQEYD